MVGRRHVPRGPRGPAIEAIAWDDRGAPQRFGRGRNPGSTPARARPRRRYPRRRKAGPRVASGANPLRLNAPPAFRQKKPWQGFCLVRESNPRHTDSASVALPTELTNGGKYGVEPLRPGAEPGALPLSYIPVRLTMEHGTGTPAAPARSESPSEMAKRTARLGRRAADVQRGCPERLRSLAVHP